MANVKVVIAAAGRGSRSGLLYPKTLFNVKGKPILIHILELLLAYDECPAVIVSPEGVNLIKECLLKYKFKAEIIVQKRPNGMGDAVLCYENSDYYNDTSDILLIWGDIPFIGKRTVDSLIKYHHTMKNDFSFITKKVDSAYTIVKRDGCNNVLEVVESREIGIGPSAGERDIGLFVFDKNIVFNLLKKDLFGKYGSITKEHGFLYIVRHLSERGYGVGATPIATNEDVISLNYLSDLSEYT